MDKLWAPWRVKYITKIIGKHKGCVFCDMFKAKNDTKNFIFARTKLCFAVLNIYPYNNGHVLVLPNRHIPDLRDLTKEEGVELLGLINHVKDLLDRTMKPAGYNVGMNLGKAAGAGFPGHLHVHIVPRWKGDVNFMPVLAHTKVISQSLKVLYQRLNKAHKTDRRSR